MSTNKHSISISGIEVQIVRKAIKNLHLAVYPPDGSVRVSVPPHVTDDNVRLAIISKLPWIKKQQAQFEAQPRQSRREVVSGESHYLWGQRYLLEVIERRGRHELEIKNNTTLVLYVNPKTIVCNRELVINEWYREQIKQRVPALIEKWQPIIGKELAEWGVKKMKTKWGSCNINVGRIWINLELAKKPLECLEYVFVHEMVHLLERNHNAVFRGYMDKFLPQWRLYRDILKTEPLAHEDWKY